MFPQIEKYRALPRLETTSDFVEGFVCAGILPERIDGIRFPIKATAGVVIIRDIDVHVPCD